MLDLLALALLGCLLGTVTGLTPGLHVNTVAIMGLGLLSRFDVSNLQFTVVLVAMAVTHTFLDFIPAIFLGVPEEETALSILPTHQLFLEGKALDAVKLTAFGSLLGLGFALALLYPTLVFIPVIYSSCRGFIVYVLILAVLALILRERKKERILWAGMIFLLSGVLGILSFDTSILSTTQVLFPVFSGLFGLSNIIYSLRSKTVHLPQEKKSMVEVDKKMVSAGFLGSFGGLLVGILPAMSPSQVGMLLYWLVGSEVRTFLVSVSAINTSDAIFSFVSLYTIGNARSGVATIAGKVLEIDLESLILLCGVMAVTAVFATLLHLAIGGLAVRFSSRIDYLALSYAAIVMVLFLVYYVTGWFGVLLACLSTTIGLLPILSGVSRTHCMGVLLLPTILYFLGI